MATSVMNLATRNITGQGSGRNTGVNVGETERWASAIGGALLTLYGLTGRTGVQTWIFPTIGGYLIYRGLSGYCPCYACMGLATAEQKGNGQGVIEAGHGVKVEQSVLIHRPAEELFRFWRNIANLPRFMRHLEEVRILNDRKSHWVARAPLGMRVEWDAEIINEQPNQLIAWRSLEGADVDTAGSVHFLSAGEGRGTEVRVILKYDPPGGKIGASVARWLGQAPEQQVHEDLIRFKHLMESGQSQRPDRVLVGSEQI